MEHAQPLPTRMPWRALALVELAALGAFGVLHVWPHAAAPAARLAAAPVHRAAVRRSTPPPSVPLRPRSRVRVLVLNGNGVAGAASRAAARLQAEGYRIGAATNAQRSDYAASMVMYVPGWSREARRLGRDAGARIVSPVDGATPLHGATLILLLGRT